MNATFKNEPAINVISKEEFEERIGKVFKLLWETLSKSFGPYGAPTIIYNYPYSHVTKDGYTIMKNISMNAKEQLVDQAIADMAADICGRLNYAVGDGTTTAVVATNSIYQNYLKLKSVLDDMHCLPRDILYEYEDIRKELIERISKKAISVQSDNEETLWKNMFKVVYISSNGDNELSTNIADLYKELKCPAINCEMAPDGVTKAKLINGFKLNMVLNDKLYVNSDENTLELPEADIIIFGVKINAVIYNSILKPLNNECRIRGRHLIVAAPSYDETALGQIIRRELTNEYSKTHDVNMVLCTYRAFNTHARKTVEDFAMLCNTLVIDRELLNSIFSEVEKKTSIIKIFNMDGKREIKGTTCIGVSAKKGAFKYSYGVDEIPEDSTDIEMIEDSIRLGYLRSISLGLKTSVAREFFYDEKRYQASLLDAKTEMVDAENKYKKLGTFNIEVSSTRQRYFSLFLKMGLIEVGGDSDLSQKLFKDSVDDAIRAAASAFDHGVVRGCNVSLLNVILNMISDTVANRESTEKSISEKDDNHFLKNLVKEYKRKEILLNILFDGFCDVYRTVLRNAFDDVSLYTTTRENNHIKDVLMDVDEEIRNFFDVEDVSDIFKNQTAYMDALDMALQKGPREETSKINLHDLIIYYSILSDSVFDVTSNAFTRNVINSVQTDEEVLIATIDLISLLMAGNQMVVTQKHNF